jgi:hypothetical protein
MPHRPGRSCIGQRQNPGCHYWRKLARACRDYSVPSCSRRRKREVVFYALRNLHKSGLDYPDAATMYRAYESELYRFDQLYRQFSEAADTADDDKGSPVIRLVQPAPHISVVKTVLVGNAVDLPIRQQPALWLDELTPRQYRIGRCWPAGLARHLQERRQWLLRQSAIPHRFGLIPSATSWCRAQ